MPTPQETRQTDPNTGGQKGTKLARFDLVPPAPLRHIAEVYGFGAQKYEDNNWFKGYPWGWSIGALERHLNAWKAGEELDPESGLPHLAHVVWHCITLMEFVRLGRGTDDRLVRSGASEFGKQVYPFRVETTETTLTTNAEGDDVCDSPLCPVSACARWQGRGR